jgi:hypothetical protein
MPVAGVLQARLGVAFSAGVEIDVLNVAAGESVLN